MTTATARRVDSVMTVTSPLVHTETTLGVDAKLRRLDYLIDGDRVAVPVLSGNSIRGMIRRAAARTLIDLCGIEPRSLSVTAFDLLHSGGGIDKGSTQGVAFRLNCAELLGDLREGLLALAGGLLTVDRVGEPAADTDQLLHHAVVAALLQGPHHRVTGFFLETSDLGVEQLQLSVGEFGQLIEPDPTLEIDRLNKGDVGVGGGHEG